MSVQEPNTLLDYGIGTLPCRVPASPNSGDIRYTLLRFSVSNPSSTTVRLAQLQFVLPIGLLAQDLTGDAYAILYRSEPIGQWTIAMTSLGVFTAIPASGSYVSVSNNGIYFQLDNIAVNTQLGAAAIRINEKASSANAPELIRTAQLALPLPRQSHFAAGRLP